MDGRNSSGHRVSLLNESEAPSAHPRLHHSVSYTGSSCSSSSSARSARLPSLPRSLTSHSRSSSYASSPALSPQTPPLSRSDSSDSRIMQIPSPITPDFAFDPALTQTSQFPSPPFGGKRHQPLPAQQQQQPQHQPQQQQQQQHQAFFPPLTKDGAMMLYPAMLQQQSAAFGFSALPAPAAPVQQQPSYLQPVTHAQSAVAAAPAAPLAEADHAPKSGSTGKPQSKKNQYPCPMAKQFNCSDYFTTSGHAARHAKKHTGRKDALCPECNKAFTRKDNMEQHRRTHQNARNAHKDGSDSSSSARKAKPAASKRPKPSPLQAGAAAAAVAALTPIDPLLPTSPGSSIAFSDAASLSQVGFQSVPSFSQYIEPVPYRYDALPVTGFTTGLDTLAIVATGEDRKRKLDE